MGLSVIAYAKATPTEHRAAVKENGIPEEWCPDDAREDHVKAFAYAGFEQSLDGLEPGVCYEVGEPFRGGSFSYGGYGEWRRDLCKIMLNVDPQVVWDNPDSYRDEPFYELIRFADNEGTIGPKAAARLAEDFDGYRAKYVEAHDSDPDPWMIQRYESMSDAFHLAASGGLVDFS